MKEFWITKATPEELKEYSFLMERIEEGGNDGADIYDIEVFIEKMKEQYPEPTKTEPTQT